MDIVILGWASSGLRIALWALVVWGILTGLDWLNNDPFSGDKARLNENALAVAHYRGARWLAIAIGSALILS